MNRLPTRRPSAPCPPRRRPLSLPHRRGVGFIWFALVVVPFFFAGSALAFDVSRLLLAHREATNVAQAAAVAAATQFSLTPGAEDTVVPASARLAAREVVTHAADQGALRVAVVDLASLDTRVGEANTRVTVSMRFEVRGLVFIGFFVDGGRSSTAEASQTAFVCVPDVRGVDGVYCRRPGR